MGQPTPSPVKKFLALYDLHYGYERRSGHKTSLHDPRAMDLALQFAEDFQPDVLILGGDILDCGAVSHHNHNKPGRTEGLRLISDARECGEQFIQPLNNIPINKRIYIVGNHERWLEDFTEDFPALEGMLDLPTLLPLEGWQIVPQGGHYNLGKLTFIHGDQISGGEHAAKAAVIAYERSVRLGHFHTAQIYTKNTPISDQLGKTGICVPCLAKKNPSYGKGKPNRHVQGFCFGYVFGDGTYADQLVMITNGRAVANGKIYTA